jgi:hypothetical protein
VQSEPMTAFHVRQLHALVLARIDDENAGQHRKTSVRIVGAAHEPTPARGIQAPMLVLLRVRYRPAVIARANRRQYYRTLAQADAGNPGSWSTSSARL